MRVVVVGSVLSLPVAVRREQRSLELPVAVELGDVTTVSPSSFPLVVALLPDGRCPSLRRPSCLQGGHTPGEW